MLREFFQARLAVQRQSFKFDFGIEDNIEANECHHQGKFDVEPSLLRSDYFVVHRSFECVVQMIHFDSILKSIDGSAKSDVRKEAKTELG